MQLAERWGLFSIPPRWPVKRRCLNQRLYGRATVPL